MFDYLHGTLTDKSLDDIPSVTIDINGVGYLISISQKDFYNIENINDKVKLFTVLIHKEDIMMLYGFLSKQSRNIFKTLTSVSGVGPKMALQILSEFDSEQIVSIISSENYIELTKTKGIGKKLAQKIIIELKDKFNYVIPLNNVPIAKNSPSIDDAKNVLISFGYEQDEISNALSYALNYVHKDNDAEDILKFALKFLSENL